MSVNSTTKTVSNNALDIIRVIAMAGIVVDHYFQASGTPFFVNTGLQLGGIFLMVFFALSSYLFGKKWVNGDYEKFNCRSFLKRRGLRIFIPLWVIFPLVILFEYLIRHTLDVKTVIFNVIGLGWFKPFGVGGHLWYITLMMFLYVVFIVFSRIRLDRLHMVYWLSGYIVLAAIYGFGGRYFSTFSSVAPVITVFFASFLFYKSEELSKCSRRWSILLMVITVFIWTLSWWMYVQGWHDIHKAIATFSSFSAGFALFICLLTFIKAAKESQTIKYFANISYEIYLTHLPLLHFTKFVFKQFGCDSMFLMIPEWLLLTWFLAFGVHKATKCLTLLINNTK